VAEINKAISVWTVFVS